MKKWQDKIKSTENMLKNTLEVVTQLHHGCWIIQENTEHLHVVNIKNAEIFPSYFQNWINHIAYEIH